MTAFVSSFVVALILGSIPVLYGRRRPVGAPTTWGEAMAAAAFVFCTLFWVYAIVPNTLIGWLTNELHWSPDQILIGPHNGFLHIPITINRQNLRDILLLLLYGFFVTVHIAEFVLWQRRGQRPAQKAVTRRSAFGRLVISRQRSGRT